MTLEFIDTSIQWRGEPINDVRHPLSIEKVWSAAELAAIGLRVRVPPPEPETPLSELRERWVANAWSRAMLEAEASIVSVTTSAGTHQYGADSTTRANIETVMIGIIAQMTPTPRPWTPKGALAPLLLTHDDLKLIAAAVGARFDAIMQNYLSHKVAILQADRAALDVYNLETGWSA